VKSVSFEFLEREWCDAKNVVELARFAAIAPPKLNFGGN
jgi:hypothetical protein